MARTGGAERREQFIRTAQELFYANGYNNTSIKDIIETVGVSKGAFYHHFDSKDAVMVAVVSRVVQQTAAMIEPILEDDALNAIEKFNRMISDVSHWKSERREQLVAMIQMMYSDDNLYLRSRLNMETTQIVVPLLACIFDQGVEEGSFHLNGISGEDAAEHIIALLRATGEAAIHMMLDPERSADAADISIRKYEAAREMIERILGAPSDSLEIINQEIFRSWFE